ncbi:MAG: efflux RND transporter permease subunit [Herminiimonas sp.]|nr:efflux RND transporter permease subunit [Herminiimonas sp.]
MAPSPAPSSFPGAPVSMAPSRAIRSTSMPTSAGAGSRPVAARSNRSSKVVRQDGRHGVLLSVLKNGGSSTLEIVNELRARLPSIAQTLPKDLIITPLFDQLVFVTSAIESVLHDAVITAILTAAMILLFFGNWRSTCIIAVSVPLSIFTSILALHALGQTI